MVVNKTLLASLCLVTLGIIGCEQEEVIRKDYPSKYPEIIYVRKIMMYDWMVGEKVSDVCFNEDEGDYVAIYKLDKVGKFKRVIRDEEIK